MTFRDVFKSSFLEKAVEFSVLDVALAMLLAFAIGLFIFTFTKTYSGSCTPRPSVFPLWR